MKTSWSLKDLKSAVKESVSIAQVIIKLKLVPAGGNYYTINKFIKLNNIDISHFKGQSWSNCKNIGPKRDIEDYLSNKYTISSSKLRNRLVREGFFDDKCYKCNHSEWLGQKISLELEHIDGNHFNNNLENLTILCPNCHSQTKTYRGRNIGKPSQ